MKNLLIIPMLIVFYDLFKLIYSIFLQKKVKKILLVDLIMIMIFFMMFTIFILPNLLVHLVLCFISSLVFVFMKIKERNEELDNYMYLALSLNEIAIILGSIAMLSLAS